ncbi:MAG: S9 family peptidase [Bacteroidales bacterium]|nr:S9 family peptidase [Bacteroidales bacterium]
MKKLLLLTIGLIFSFGVFAQGDYQKLNLEDVVNYAFWPNSVWGVNSMNDGEHYTTYDVNRATRSASIKKFSYKTGEEVETLVNLTKLGIGWVSWNYTFSDDETKILIYTDDEDIYRHSFVANFYVYDLTSKKLTAISENGKQQIASFSPDGQKVAFMRDNNLYIKDLVSLEEKQITFDGEKNKIINGAPDWVYEEEFGYNQAYQWSPNGKYIGFVRFDETNVREFSILKYAGEKPHNSEYELYPGVYTYKYPKAGEDNSRVTVHVYNLEKESTVKVDVCKKPDFYVPRIFWNADGSRLIVERLNREQNELSIIVANPEDGQVKPLFSENNKYYIGDEIYDNIIFLEDGEHIIVMSERDGYRHLYLYNVNGELVNQITKGEWDVIEYLGYDADKKIVYYQSAESSPLNRDIYSIKIDGKKKTKINTVDGTNDVEFSNGFKYYILTFSDINTPSYITLHNSKGNVIRVLEDNATLKQDVEAFGGVNKTLFKFTTSEGIELNAYKIVPPDFDETKIYPAIVTQYSGPNSQRVLNTWSYSWENYLAQQGFVIIGVDPRGTGGRGEEFRKVTFKQLGKYETIDLIETAKYIGSLPYINKDKLGLWGWSYGGFMVLNVMTKGKGIYNTGVSVAPVTNWRYYDNIYTERYMGKPQDNASGYDDNSPLNYAADLEGNLLLAFGTADDNVHPQNSFEMIAKLVEAEKQFTTLPYPNRNHGIYGGNTSIHLYTMKTNFLIKHLIEE